MIGMDCRQIEQLISPYIDCELSLSEFAEVKAHLKICAHCSQEYELMLQMSSALHQMDQVVVPAPPGFTASLMERINSEDSTVKPPVQGRWFDNHWRQAVAGLAAAVMLAFTAFSINLGPIMQVAENPPTVIQADNGTSAVNPSDNYNGDSVAEIQTNINQNNQPNSNPTLVAQNSDRPLTPLVLLNKERTLTTTLLQIKTSDSSGALQQALNLAADASAQVLNLGQQATESGSYTVLQITATKKAADNLIIGLTNLGNVTSKEVTSNDITTQFTDKLSQYQSLFAQRAAVQDDNQAASLDQRITVLENELKDWDLKAEQETIIVWLQK